METKRPENVQVASVIVELKDRGCRDDVLKLAKEDLELGYPKELVVCRGRMADGPLQEVFLHHAGKQ